ncbi:uncharacterized protein LOC120342177 [Styela clava]
MESTCDINNEMIKMRKEIKRGKIWAITKLVRNVRNLRNKKGNEMQLSKNKRRAERLIEEIDVIKDLKPDDVFKALLNSDSKSCPQSLMNSDLPLTQRAIIRIGSATFIQTRMSDIKYKVSTFNLERTNKPSSKTIEECEPPLNDVGDVKQDNELQMRLETATKNLMQKKPLSKKQKPDQFIALQTDNLKIDEISSNLMPEENNSTEDGDSMEGDIISDDEEEEREASNDDTPHQNDDDVSVTKEDASPMVVEERIIGTTAEGYQIVLPLLPTTHDKSVSQEANKKNFNDIAEGAEDVTDVLTNIGENFHSDDDASDSDIEYEDLAELALKSKQNLNKDAENKEDMFFMDAKGSSDKKFQRIVSKSNKSESSDDEELRQVKSCFVESLASVSHQRTKGKNRMSQRARKRLHSKKKTSEHSNNNDSKKSNSTNKSGKMQNNLKTETSLKTIELQPFHPSWEASRKRKEQQSMIKQFKGKRVCFDDSD